MVENWKEIQPDFTSELQKEWEKREFSYEECKEWINVGLSIHEYELTTYLKEKAYIPSWVRDFGNVGRLREEYSKSLANKTNNDIISEKNENWKNIHLDFTLELQKNWQNLNFTYQQTQDWINIGLTVQDYNLVKWLQDTMGETPESILNSAIFLSDLRGQYQKHWQTKIIEEPKEFGDRLTKWEALAIGKIGRKELSGEERKIKPPFSSREIFVDVPEEKLVEELTKKLKLINDFRNAYNRIEKILGEREYKWDGKLGAETNFLVMGNIFKYAQAGKSHNFPNLGRELAHFVESWFKLRNLALKVKIDNALREKISNLESEILVEKKKNQELVQKIKELERVGEIKKRNELLVEELQNYMGNQELANQVFQKIDNQIVYWNKNYIYTNKIINNMVNNNNSKWEKELIIQWESVELGDEAEQETENLFVSSSGCYENFAVIAGCDEEFLLFKPNFFANTKYKNSFKKGKIYRFGFNGELSKNSSNIINPMEENNFEINEISEVVPFIKNTYQEKEKSVERKNVVEKELAEKNNTIQGINKERFDAKKELAELKIKFDSLQFEKTEIENKWTNPEKHKELLDIQKDLEEKLKAIKEENKKLSSKLEEISKQDWNTTLAKKIQGKKDELEKLKDKARNKLDNNMLKSSLEVYLTANEQLTILKMEKVDERICSPTKRQMERSAENLKKKITSEELQSLCLIHSEIVKMEIQQKQWEEWKAQEQQFEAYVEVPIMID